MVVDDHPMWRDAVERDLAAAGFDVVAVAAERRRGAGPVPGRAPHVVVLDLQIPGPNGVEVTAEVLQQDPAARVLILSASGEQADVLEAVKAGATGYLVKSASSDELLDAVRRVAAGDTVFTPGLAGLVLGEFRRLLDAARRRPPDGTSPAHRARDRGAAAGRQGAVLQADRRAARALPPHRPEPRPEHAAQAAAAQPGPADPLRHRAGPRRRCLRRRTPLLEIADELYGLALAEFTPARDALVKELKAEDAALARQVKTLRKPSLAAWVVNLLVRRETEQVDQVIAVGAALRQAQAEPRRGGATRAHPPAPPAHRRGHDPGPQRVAAERGQKVTAAVADQVEATLTAAMVDEGCARPCAAGCSSRPATHRRRRRRPRPAVARSRGAGLRRRGTHGSRPPPRPDLHVVPDPEADRKAVAAAERAARRRRREAAEAEQALAAAARTWRSSRRAACRCRPRSTSCGAASPSSRPSSEEVDDELADAEDVRAEAQDALAAATREREAADAALQRLRQD